MNSAPTSLPTTYFDDLYARNIDPWGFETRDYEHNKYAATLAALPQPHYGAALEIGCSIGVLTRQLAARCDRLLALDAAAAPLELARARTADQPGVEIREARVPEQWPEGESFDLILISEVLYFFGGDDLGRVANCVDRSLRPGGDVVLVHWLAQTDFPLTGDEAVEGFLAASRNGLTRTGGSRNEFYRLDVLRRIG
ncbi:SAM-dependent methyltransferase [Roseomonas elaeocarpi]|uniref:SAM-dependent methyltransferase n=1 Tax=Roseomonas elaeocarpi TaxID=907779 RepID=A0ABV6JQ74_9PROT